MGADVTRVTIAVLTFRRPASLETLLPALLDQAATGSSAHPCEVDVLVVDNDLEASASAAVARVRDGQGGGRLRYVAEPVPGIAAARNRALDEAEGSRLLVFIDDDENPDVGWLGALCQTWADTGAAAVAGRVVEAFSAPPDPWIVAGRFFQRRSLPTGTPVAAAGAGNLLLDLDQIRALGVRFDDRLGMAGGEDTLFCAQLRRRGGVIVWCEEARAFDNIPATRLSRRWVLARAFSHGITAARVALLLADGPAVRMVVRAQLMTRGLVRVAGGSARGLLGLVAGRAEHQARGLRTALRGVGMAAAAAGWTHQEYRRSNPVGATG